MKRLCLLLCLPLLCGGGCSGWNNPKTKLSGGPFGSLFDFYDDKDNDILIEDAEFFHQHPEKGTGGTIKKLTIRNNASDVLTAQIELMRQYNEQMKTANEGITRVLSGLESIVGRVTPFLPGGSPAPSPGPAPGPAP